MDNLENVEPVGGVRVTKSKAKFNSIGPVYISQNSNPREDLHGDQTVVIINSRNGKQKMIQQVYIPQIEGTTKKRPHTQENARRARKGLRHGVSPKASVNNSIETDKFKKEAKPEP